MVRAGRGIVAALAAMILVTGCEGGTVPPAASSAAIASPSGDPAPSGLAAAGASLGVTGSSAGSPGGVTQAGSIPNASNPASSGVASSQAGPSPAPAAVARRSPALIATTLRLRLPYPLSRTVALVDGSAILVLGGLTGTGTTGTILRLTPDAGTVVRLGRLASAVHDAAGATLGGVSYVLGGGVISQDSAIQRVAPSGRTSVVGRLPAPRADLAALVVGDSLVILGGGANGRTDRKVLSTVDGVHVNVIATLPTGVRYAAVAQLDGLVYVFGGSSDAGDISTIQVVDPVAGTARVLGHLPAALSHATAFVIDGSIFIAGGRRAGRPLATILRFDPATGRTVAAGRLPRAMSDAAVAVVGGTAYLIGGEGSGLMASIIAISAR
jgi:hypothetical protein